MDLYPLNFYALVTRLGDVLISNLARLEQWNLIYAKLQAYRFVPFKIIEKSPKITALREKSLNARISLTYRLRKKPFRGHTFCPIGVFCTSGIIFAKVIPFLKSVRMIKSIRSRTDNSLTRFSHAVLPFKQSILVILVKHLYVLRKENQFPFGVIERKLWMYHGTLKSRLTVMYPLQLCGSGLTAVHDLFPRWKLFCLNHSKLAGIKFL